jgi:small subunit ribosomal protein S16
MGCPRLRTWFPAVRDKKTRKTPPPNRAARMSPSIQTKSFGGYRKMVKIRLKRLGAKKAPFYRVVVSDSRVQRDGVAIAEIGYYDPKKDPAEIKIDADAAKKWLGSGAQPTDTVKYLFKKAGIADS